jgi:peptide/nickel transport system substrate-binding protein
MRNPRSRAIAVAVLVMAFLAVNVAGCTKAEPPPAPVVEDPKFGGTALWRLNGEVSTLNPILGADGTAGLIKSFISETLGGVDYDGSWDGRLATGYTVSADGLTYTFSLRQGVKWHDGQPFTADDVIFTFDLIMNEAYKAPVRTRMMIGGKPITWHKVDDYTVNMVVPEVTATCIEHLRNIPIVPKHLLKDVAPADFATCAYANHPVLTGPFKFVEYKTGEYVRLQRFDDYWGGKPYLEQIVIRIIPDQAAAVVALESGQIDITSVAADVALRLKQQGNVRVYQGPGSGIFFVCLNNKVFPFDDVKVRQAMNHALNREGIVQQVYLGLAVPSYNFIAQNVIYYSEDVLTKYQFDLERAKTLLAEAGFTPGPDGILVKDGKKFEFEINFIAGDPAIEKTLLIYQSDLEKIGIRAEPRGLEASVYVRVLTSGTDPLPYQAMFNSMSPGIDPDSYALVYHGCQYPAGLKGWNYVGYTNPVVDELFDLGKRELDPARRAFYYEEIQRIISRDAAIVPTVYPYNSTATTLRLRLEEAEMHPETTKRFPWPGKLYLEK